MEPITALFTVAKFKAGFNKLVKSPWTYVILAFLAIGTGTYFYLKHSTEQQVTAAVKNADSNATIQSYETKGKVEDASAAIDEQFDRRRAQTQKEYVNVRTVVQQAPAQDRNAPASPVLIDTLNGLERLHSRQEQGGVPDADVPVG